MQLDAGTSRRCVYEPLGSHYPSVVRRSVATTGDDSVGIDLARAVGPRYGYGHSSHIQIRSKLAPLTSEPVVLEYGFGRKLNWSAIGWPISFFPGRIAQLVRAHR